MIPFTRICGALWWGWFFYWCITARGTKRTVHREDYLKRFLIGLSFWIAILFLFTNIWTFNIPNIQILPQSLLFGVLGLIITATGLGFAIWARRFLGRNWSGHPELKQDHELITAGPYRTIRHPIYTGLLIAAFGTAISYGTLRPFLSVPVMFAGFWPKLLIEEKLMLKQFPETYPAYQRRSSALFPHIL